MKTIFLFIYLLLFTSVAFAQQNQLLNIVNSPLDTIDCNAPCANVVANYVKPKLTNTYVVNSIPYAPISTAGSTTVTLADDYFTGAIPIGFPFCFYSQTYTDLYISANGHISFNSNYNAMPCSFDTKKPMPFYNSTYPDNAIFCPFIDISTQFGGSVSYNTIGTAPFRKMIINYNAIPYFNTACTGAPVTFQCILYETTNIIECHITSKSVCNTDPNEYLNFATLGIQSAGANNFLTAPGKNATIWTATNESWRFSPNGANAYSISWVDNLMPVASNVDSITVCNPFPHTVVATLNLTCPAVQVKDTITLVKFFPIIDSIVITKTSCKNVADGSIKIYASGVNPLLYSVDNTNYTSNWQYNNLAYGSHQVYVKDGNGCVTVTMINIGTNSSLTAQIDSFKNPTCPNSNGKIWASFTGGVPPYTYYWNGPNTVNVVANPITGLTQGIYFVTVIDAAGCRDSVGIALVYDSLPNATAVITKPVCANASGIIDITPTGGTAPYTYLWSNNATTQDLINVAAGNYSVTITDANGCTKVRYFQLNDTLNLALNIGNVVPTHCGLNNGEAMVLAYNGLAPYTYSWTGGATVYNATNLAAGMQYVTVVDANGCTRHDSVNIGPSLPLVIQLLPANAHCDSANGLISALITNATGIISYLWSTNATTSSINLLAPGMYWLTATDGIGCTTTDSAQVNDDGVPHLHIVEYKAPICKGDTTGRVVLDGISGVAPYKYSFDGINFSATAVLTNFAAGTYTIYIRDANSCITDTVITFNEPEEIVIFTTKPDTLICYNDSTASFTVTAIKGTRPYLWNFNNTGWGTDTVFTNLGIGNYLVQLKDSNGCKMQSNVEVVGPFLPLNIKLTVTDIPCYQEHTGKLLAELTGGWQPLTFKWSHNNLNFTFLDKQDAGFYSINVKDSKGCEVSASDTIHQDYCCNAYIPNVFSPNGDGNNDVLRLITPSKDITEYLLKIYNRWGNEVFVTKNITEGWNGKIENVDANMDTYYYFMYYKCAFSKERIMVKGDITLLR